MVLRRAEQVAVVYDRFRVRFATPAALAEAPLCDIQEAIGSLGLRWRARFLSALGQKVTELGGVLPADRNRLLTLPGVGRYVASAFLSFHAGVRACIIDSNVVRFYGRYFSFSTDSETRRTYFIQALSD